MTLGLGVQIGAWSNFEKEKETQEVLTRTKLGVKEQLHGEE